MTDTVSAAAPASATVPAAPTAKEIARSATAGVNVSATSVVTSSLGAVFGAVIAIAAILIAIFVSEPMIRLLAAFAAAGAVGFVIAVIWNHLHLNATASANTLNSLGAAHGAAQQATEALQTVLNTIAPAAASPAPAASAAPAPAAS